MATAIACINHIENMMYNRMSECRGRRGCHYIRIDQMVRGKVSGLFCAICIHWRFVNLMFVFFVQFVRFFRI